MEIRRQALVKLGLTSAMPVVTHLKSAGASQGPSKCGSGQKHVPTGCHDRD